MTLTEKLLYEAEGFSLAPPVYGEPHGPGGAGFDNGCLESAREQLNCEVAPAFGLGVSDVAGRENKRGPIRSVAHPLGQFSEPL